VSFTSYIVLELNGRLQFLDNGILQILSNATNGLSIVLEHRWVPFLRLQLILRYYGKSIPVESLSTDDLRFLNNAEALEDSAYVRSPSGCSTQLTSSSSRTSKPQKDSYH